MRSLVERHREQLVKLCKRHHVCRLEAFGSITEDRFDPTRSDLDFLVEFDDLDVDAYAEAYFGLLEDLEALFGRPVDLVMTAAIANPYFLQDIAASRSLVYATQS